MKIQIVILVSCLAAFAASMTVQQKVFLMSPEEIKEVGRMYRHENGKRIVV